MIQKLKTKALLVTAVLTMAATVFSCSKKDDEITPAQASIVGNWEIAKEGSLIDGKEVLTDYIHSSCGKNSMEIKADGMAALHIYDITPGNDSVKECNEYLINSTWKKEDNKLILTFLNNETQNSETVVPEIVTLNATELKLKYQGRGASTIYCLY